MSQPSLMVYRAGSNELQKSLETLPDRQPAILEDYLLCQEYSQPMVRQELAI